MSKLVRGFVTFVGGGLAVTIYEGFVVCHYWNWFVSPMLHLPEARLIPVIGIWLMLSFLRFEPKSSDFDHWVRLFAVVEILVPAEQQQHVRDEYEKAVMKKIEMRPLALRAFLRITAILVFGYILHSFV